MKTKKYFYSLVIGQCTSALILTLRSEKGCNRKSYEFNMLWFLENLKDITAGVNTKSNPFLSLKGHDFTFKTMRQGVMLTRVKEVP